MPSLNWIGKKEIKNYHNNIEYRTINCIESIGEEKFLNMIRY